MFGGETSVERLWLVVNDAAPPGKELKYARLERERRFLLRVSPAEGVVKTTRIADRYLLGTRLRLRRAIETVTVGGIGERTVYKLTQKVPAPDGGPGLITTLYLDAVEYAVLEQLPAATVHKTRLSVPPLGIDVFEDALAGLVLAEAEFDDERVARELHTATRGGGRGDPGPAPHRREPGGDDESRDRGRPGRLRSIRSRSVRNR